jgi:uncharacterized protein YebE (UPF0316 family)
MSAVIVAMLPPHLTHGGFWKMGIKKRSQQE